MTKKGPHPQRRWRLIRMRYYPNAWVCFEMHPCGSWIWAGTEAEVHF